jgi:hypothetical protein
MGMSRYRTGGSNMSAENKKRNIRIMLLRILSVLAVNAFIYAGFSMLRASIFQDDGGAAAIVLYAAVVCFAHVLGVLFASANPKIFNRTVQTKSFRFLAFMLNIRDSERFISSSAVWGLIIIPLASALIIYGRHGLTRSFFELLPAAAAYIISLKQSRLAPAQIMSTISLFTGMTIMVICLELPYLVSRLAYLRPIYFAVSYFLIFAFLIVKNQEDIERQIFRKKHIDKSVLPRDLRRFNALSTCFIFILTMLLFNLKTVVMHLMEIAKQIVQLVYILFMWLLDKIMTDQTSAGEPLQNNTNILPAQRPMPFFNLVINVLMYFVILYAAYKLLFAIGIRAPKAISRILDMLRKLFRINSGNAATEESDFVDTTEIVLPDMRNTVNKTKKKKVRAKKLGQITDPVEKVRLMYGNILGLLPLFGVKPDHCDTTAQILAKAAGSPQVREGLSGFTAIYDRLRYGEMVPDKDTLAKAEKYYSNIDKGALPQ